MATLTAPTLRQLITNARILLNQRDPNNSFWQDDELTTYINDGVQLYFLECVQANEGYFTTTADLNIVTDVETISLPSDFFHAKNVWKKLTNGYAVMSYCNALNEGYSTQGGSAMESYIPQYNFRGNSLVIHPVPNFSQTGGIKIEYIQFPEVLIWGGNALTTQISPVFRQLVEMYAVFKAKFREAMVTGGNMHKVPEENLAALYNAFKTSLVSRSHNPTFIQPFNPEM